MWFLIKYLYEKSFVYYTVNMEHIFRNFHRPEFHKY
jgi:hypothetical protein